MTRVKVDLYGKRGYRQTEVTPETPSRFGQVAPQPTEPATITPNPITPIEAVIPAYKEAWTENRDRLLAYLTIGFHGNLSDGVTLHELGTALEIQYAPRKAMNADQWHAWIGDLQTEDYNSVDWIKALKTKIYRKYEDLRPPHPHTDPEGDIKVYLLDVEDGELLIYAYDEPRHRELLEFKWERYCHQYRCSVRIETPTETFTITADQTEHSEVA